MHGYYGIRTNRATCDIGFACLKRAADAAASPHAAQAVDVYGTAAAIHIKYARLRSLNANDVAYGVALIPKPGGFVVAAVSGWLEASLCITVTPQQHHC